MPVFTTPRNSPLQQTHERNGTGGKKPNTGRQSPPSCSSNSTGRSRTMSGHPNPSNEMSNHANYTISKEQRNLTPCYLDSSEENKQLYMFLNSIVIQYLDILGLQQSISTFIQESQDEGYPLPPSLSSAVDKFSINLDPERIRPKDVCQLLKHFDDEHTRPLLEKWRYMRNKCPVENRPEEQRLNVHLRIYCYITIPFRQNFSDDEKQVNIQHLIEEFKAKNHDDCNDPEILSLYAIPYVSNPVQHPVFSKFFTTSWIQKLRKNLTAHCQSLCRRLPDAFETDLAKLYRLWSNTNVVMHNFVNLDNNAWGQSSSARSRNLDNLKLVPANAQTICEFPEDSLFKTFFDSIIRLKQESLKMKESDRFLKSEYMEKIQLCDALVTCLKEMYLKREGDTTIPWERIMQKCSEVSLSESNPSQYSLRGESMVVNPPSSRTDFRTEVEFQRPPTCCDRDNRIYSRNFTTLRNSLPCTGRQGQSFGDNVTAVSGRNACSNEPTSRAVTQTLPTGKQNLYEDEGSGGDYNREQIKQQLPPLPPRRLFDRMSSVRSDPDHNSPRGLLDRIQTNNMLRSIVRESEYP